MNPGKNKWFIVLFLYKVKLPITIGMICFTPVFALFISCRSPALEREAPAVNEVIIGSEFRINLPEDHTTGYGWQLNPDFDKNLVTEISAVWHGNKKGIDFNFRAKSVGETALNFVNRKYTDTAGIKLFLVKIIPRD